MPGAASSEIFQRSKHSPDHVLRSVVDADHPWLVDLHNDPIVLRNVTDPTPISLDHHLNWWRSLDRVRQVRAVYDYQGAAAGFAKFYSIDRVNKNCALGADLHKDFRGRGLAREMLTLMIDYAFDKLGMHRVYLSTAEFNNVAQKVYEGLGFTHEGHYRESLFRDGRFYDQRLMYLTEDRWNAAKHSAHKGK